MKKIWKVLLVLLLVLALLGAAAWAVPYYVMGIDIFDRSGWHVTEEGDTQYLDYYGDPLTGWQQIEEE